MINTLRALALAALMLIAPAARAEPEWMSFTGQLGRVRVVIENPISTATYQIRALDPITSDTVSSTTLPAGATETWLRGLSPLEDSYLIEIRREDERIALEGVRTQGALIGIFPARIQPHLIAAFDDVAASAGLSLQQKEQMLGIWILTMTRAEERAGLAEADAIERERLRKLREFGGGE